MESELWPWPCLTVWPGPLHNYIMWHELLDHIGAALMRFSEMFEPGPYE